MLFFHLKHYPLRTLDGLGEMARKYKKSVHAVGPLLTWSTPFDKKDVPRSVSAPAGPVVPLVEMALSMLKLAEHAFEETPGGVTFAEYIDTVIGRQQGVAPPGDEAFLADLRKQATAALGLGKAPYPKGGPSASRGKPPAASGRKGGG